MSEFIHTRKRELKSYGIADHGIATA